MELAGQSTSTPMAMARALLMGMFDMQTLLKSNLKGGAIKRPGADVHLHGLDNSKLEAIYG